VSSSHATNRAEKARLAVLISGNGSNLQALIDACASGGLNADITLVISNRADAFGLERARRAGIKTAVIDHRQFTDRASFDRALADRLEQVGADWIVLAGFMRILTPEFVQRFLGRMINIHPSLLPKHPGLNTHARAIEAGDEKHGATVHFVTPTVDAGPAILQGQLAVAPGESAEALQQRVHTLEHRIYPQALRWLIEGAIGFDGETATWEGRPVRTVGRLTADGQLLPPET